MLKDLSQEEIDILLAGGTLPYKQFSSREEWLADMSDEDRASIFAAWKESNARYAEYVRSEAEKGIDVIADSKRLL